jgi:hypothetical protein
MRRSLANSLLPSGEKVAEGRLRGEAVPRHWD